jgi:integrase
VPIEAELVCVIEAYLHSRAIRSPATVKRKTNTAAPPLSQWPDRSPLFVGRDGERITRGTLQPRIKRAFKRAGPDAQPVPGALVHGLRHTYATELANSDQSMCLGPLRGTGPYAVPSLTRRRGWSGHDWASAIPPDRRSGTQASQLLIS